MRVFAAWHKDRETRCSCASGGVFFSLAERFIEEGGIVVGAAFAEHFHVEHIFAEDCSELEKLKKSKYVQSDLKDTFPKTKEMLESGRKVLFSGTPCQVTALSKYLGRDYENLFLCTLFCYGTPERSVYEKYIRFLEESEKSQITGIDFKDKRFGWDYYTTKIDFENGNSQCRFGGDSYKELMHLGYSLCQACLHCKFDFDNVDADFVLGDFYSYSAYIDRRPPKSGVNCVVIKTGKGYRLFEHVDCLEKTEIDSIRFFENEKRRLREFDEDKRRMFLENLAVSDYRTACGKVGVAIDKKLSFREHLISIKKRAERD